MRIKGIKSVPNAEYLWSLELVNKEGSTKSAFYIDSLDCIYDNNKLKVTLILL